MQPKRSHPLRMFLPLIVVVGLAILWSIWWYVVFTTVKSQYAAQEEQLAAKGITLACAQQSWGGYPFRVEMTCQSPQLGIEQNGQVIMVTGSSLTALLQAYNPTHVIALWSGPTVAKPPDGEPLEIKHRQATASARIIDQGRIQVAAVIPDVTVAGLGTAKSIELHGRGGETGKADFAGSIDMLSATLPNGKIVALDRADVEASLPAELLQAGDPLRKAAETAAVLEVTRIDLKQGPLTAQASGSASLDAQGRINGNMTASVNDLDQLLQRISSDFDLTPDDVNAVKTMLGILKASGSKVDIVAKDGKLYWGLIKLGEVPPLLPAS